MIYYLITQGLILFVVIAALFDFLIRQKVRIDELERRLELSTTITTESWSKSMPYHIKQTFPVNGLVELILKESRIVPQYEAAIEGRPKKLVRRN